MCDKKLYRMSVDINPSGVKYYFIEEYLLGEWLQVPPRERYLNYAIAEAELNRLKDNANSAKIDAQAEDLPRPDLTKFKFKEEIAADVFNEDFERETYQSYTGSIQLSFTGRRLLANLRDAITGAINGRHYSFNDNAVAKARGDLASYMSKLESKRVKSPVDRYSIKEFSATELYQELGRRLGL